jgi:FKBP-type peptidyl-prolyl cis-trans isomerase 2
MFVRSISLSWWVVWIGLVLSGQGFALASAETPSSATVRAGKQVLFEYTLRLDNQIVLDTNVGSEPLSYIHGLQQLMPGLEKGLKGLRIGESKKFVVQPEKGYGLVDKHAFMESKKSNISPEVLKVGGMIEGQDSTGRPMYPRIKEIRETEVILDYNHPLAGKILYFDVKVLDIKKPQVPPHGE